MVVVVSLSELVVLVVVLTSGTTCNAKSRCTFQRQHASLHAHVYSDKHVCMSPNSQTAVVVVDSLVEALVVLVVVLALACQHVMQGLDAYH